MGYRGLQLVTWGYRGLQSVARLQGVTSGYRGLQRVRGRYKGYLYIITKIVI